MENLLAILQPHAAWLFGSGGVAAVVLSFLKFFRGSGKEKSATAGQPAGNGIGDAHASGDIVGGNKTTNNGLGGQSVVLIVALVVCLGGLGLMFAGDTINASGNSAGVKGSGNKTNVTTTVPSD